MMNQTETLKFIEHLFVYLCSNDHSCYMQQLYEHCSLELEKRQTNWWWFTQQQFPRAFELIKKN